MTEENTPAAAWDLPALRRRSDLLFGSPHRLPVALMAATAERHELYPRRIAQRAGVRDKDAARMLLDFLAAELLEPDDPPGGRRGRGRPPRHLRRREDEFWACVLALGERFRRPPPGSARG